MARILVVLEEYCTGCGRCQIACADRHEAAFVPALACLGLEIFPQCGRAVPSVCFQCANPDCLAACPENAIRHNESGTVLVLSTLCSGCGACVRACPWGQIRIDAHNMAIKCDLCGGEPACAPACHFGALLFAEPDKNLRKHRGRQMEDRSMDENFARKRRQLATRLIGREHGRACLKS